MPMVITSNWPPLVAMSVVTRERSVPSSRVTHLSLMSGNAFSNCGVSFCISIMWPLLTVAITRSVAVAAPLARARQQAIASGGLIIMERLLSCFRVSAVGRGADSAKIGVMQWVA